MELLICTQDLGAYDTGDIMDIRADSFAWGSQEIANARFNLIQVPDGELGGDLAAAQALYLASLYDGEEDGTDTKSRKWCVVSGDLVEKTVDSTDPLVVSTAVDKALTVTQV